MSARVLILTASKSAGRDVPAEVLAAALRERGASADVVDGLGLAGPAARALVRAAPSPRSAAGGVAADAGHALARFGPARRAGARAVQRLAGGRLEAHLREHPADVVVSTSPLATLPLARMRAAGTLRAPLVSAITDVAGLQWWAHPAVDLHLLAHPESEPEVRSFAGPAARAEAARGLTAPGFSDPPERSAARAALELPGRGSLVVVSDGGRDAGDLRAAVDTALHYGADTVVVLAGHESEGRAPMEAVYGEDDRVRIWSAADRTVTLLAAADVLIHATAGPAVLEALMCDCRVIAYGRGRGRAGANNRAYERLGMVAVARTRPQLAHALIHALAAPPQAAQAPELPAAAELVLGLTEHEPAHAA